MGFLVKTTWDSKAKDLRRKITSRAREKVPTKPAWITKKVWAQLRAMWEDEDYVTLRCVASSNRHSETGGSLHTQGSKNQLKHELELHRRLGRIPHKGEVFKKCHTRKGTQTFVDKRSSDAYDTFVNLCSQAESQPSESSNNESGTQPKPIDYDTLMIEAVGGRNGKGIVYGLSLDGHILTRGSTSTSNRYSNYADIARGMSGEVEARLRQKIADQQQTINTILARQNKMFAAFAKHIDLDLMDLDEDDPSVGNGTLGSNANDDTNADE
ncbi:hypothetical protein TSUD_81430 [Trifolium subterraneum]|uniref:Transposase, Ptta/En/Spm, plant n=1 Tax=Trifolium subterraneum TaxID=3900 RepID=A0A2Z6P0T0_TRISU|nr:hypothetical protein TSUD_81430 [Trifolium subterraneum]